MRHLIKIVLPVLMIALLFSSCSEHFVEARRISIWNYDTIPLTIYVDGDEAVEINEFWGAIYLNSGNYEIVAKSDGKEIDRVSVSVPVKKDGNKYNMDIFMVGQDKNFAMLNVGELYSNGTDFDLEETYFNTNHVEITNNPYRIYYPWSTLPLSIYTSAGTPDVYQLFELPKGYEDKSDDEIITYCSSLIR
jgi:hypothetical protein